jgi:transcriptional regulator with XRE-family HTH domain
MSTKLIDKGAAMNRCQTQYTPKRIQTLLKRAGITQKQIAEEEGKSAMAVSDVINFRMVSKDLMEAIARRIDADPKDVFAWYFCQKRPQRPCKRR